MEYIAPNGKGAFLYTGAMEGPELFLGPSRLVNFNPDNDVFFVGKIAVSTGTPLSNNRRHHRKTQTLQASGTLLWGVILYSAEAEYLQGAVETDNGRVWAFPEFEESFFWGLNYNQLYWPDDSNDRIALVEIDVPSSVNNGESGFTLQFRKEETKATAGKYVTVRLDMRNAGEETMEGGVVVVDVPEWMKLVAYNLKFTGSHGRAKKISQARSTKSGHFDKNAVHRNMQDSLGAPFLLGPDKKAVLNLKYWIQDCTPDKSEGLMVPYLLFPGGTAIPGTDNATVRHLCRFLNV